MKFRILWIDDKPDSVKKQLDEIKNFISENQFEPEIEIISDMDDISKKVKKELKKDFDLLVTDNNLEDGFSGKDVIKLVREQGLLIDVLFYSIVGKIELEETRGDYRFIEIVESKNKILSPLKDLILKNIKRCEDIVFLRGLVLSKVIELEVELNELFETYFEIQRDKKPHFHSYMMETNLFSLYQKSYTFSKILENNKTLLKEIKLTKTQLDKIAEQRNIIAHCKISPTKKNCLVYKGEDNHYTREDIKKLIGKINEHISDIRSAKEKLTSSPKKN